MAVSLKHDFQSAIADDADTSLVRPVDWNAEHELTLATDKLLGRDTAGAGAVEEIGLATSLEFTGSGSIQRSALTGDVTASAGSNATTIANAAVTLAKMANLAQDQVIGRVTASTGVPETFTVTAAARTILDDTTTAAIATTLGLGTASNPQFATVELGNASDTTLSRSAAGVLAVEGNHVPSPASQAQGDVLFHNGTTWARLGAGNSGEFLKTQGAAANPIWAAISGGKLAQIVSTTWATETAFTNSFNSDDTNWQSGEGTERFTLAITPTNASSTLYVLAAVTCEVKCATSTQADWDIEVGAALFRDATANSITANMMKTGMYHHTTASGNMYANGDLMLFAAVSAAATSASTFKIRTGRTTNGTITATTTHNGTDTLGAVRWSWMLIAEVLP